VIVTAGFAFQIEWTYAALYMDWSDKDKCTL